MFLHLSVILGAGTPDVIGMLDTVIILVHTFGYDLLFRTFLRSDTS
jgi:hypothetical protein